MILTSIFEHFSKPFRDMVFASVGVTQRIALTGVILFILVEIGLNIIRFFSGSGESFPSFQKTLSYIVLFFFLLSYGPVMRTFDGLIDFIEGQIREQGSSDYLTITSDLVKLKNIQHAAQLEQVAHDASRIDQVWTEMKNTYENVKAGFQSTLEAFTISLPALLFASIADGITGILRYLIEILSILITGVLIILGPLAVMFQTAPFIGEGVLKNWFSTWLSVKCWCITMSVIDMMMHKFLMLFIEQKHDGLSTLFEDFGMTSTWLLVINLSFIILFIMTPMLTNYYVKGSGGAFMSKMIGAATTIVHTAAGTATLGTTTAATKLLNGSVGALSDKLDSISKKLHSTKHG